MHVFVSSRSGFTLKVSQSSPVWSGPKAYYYDYHNKNTKKSEADPSVSRRGRKHGQEHNDLNYNDSTKLRVKVSLATLLL